MDLEQNGERLHFTMAFIGGCLGVYSLLHFSNLFGSAQTNNLISMTVCLVSGSWSELLLRLVGALLYIAAIGLVVALPRRVRLDVRFLSLLVSAVTVLLLGLLPADTPPLVGLYPLFFATAFQWNAFPGASGFLSSTIFSTNNLRQFTSASVEVLLNRNDSYRPKARFFGLTLLSYHAGVAVMYLLWQTAGFQSVWFCFLPLLAAYRRVRRAVQGSRSSGAHAPST